MAPARMFLDALTGSRHGELYMTRSLRKVHKSPVIVSGYDAVLQDVVGLLEDARHAAARAVNSAMTVVYWLICRRLVEQEQGGSHRAGYGEALLKRLSANLVARYGRRRVSGSRTAFSSLAASPNHGLLHAGRVTQRPPSEKKAHRLRGLEKASLAPQRGLEPRTRWLTVTEDGAPPHPVVIFDAKMAIQARGAPQTDGSVGRR
jgi:hypothetical protein